MKDNTVISRKFLEQYLQISPMVFNDASLNKYISKQAVVEKLEKNVYRLKTPFSGEEGIGILDPKTFWTVLTRTEMAKYFLWDASAYKIVSAKLN